MAGVGPTGGPAIECEKLSKRFGQVEALRSIDLRVPHGIAFGLLGPNGARSEIHAGRGWAALFFPANFSQDLLARQASITVMLNGSSPVIVSAVLGSVRAAVEKTFAGVAGTAPLSLDPDYVYGSDETRFIDSFAPGIMALAVLMVTSTFSVFIIARERTGGMLERLFATSLRSSEVVVGHALALSVVALAQTTVVLSAALLLFRIQVVGDIGLAFVILVLFAIGNQGLGTVESAAARNELQAVQFIPLVLFPSLLLSGVFFPLEAIPRDFRPLSLAVPLTYAGDALRSIMLRGWGIGEIGDDLLVLLVYAGLTLLGATVLLRRRV